jgi:hypothetical protein
VYDVLSVSRAERRAFCGGAFKYLRALNGRIVKRISEKPPSASALMAVFRFGQNLEVNNRKLQGYEKIYVTKSE